MKRYAITGILFFVTAFFVAPGLRAQNDTITPIEAIDAALHLDMYATVEGVVIQYTTAREGATAYYILKGESGEPIQVNTSFKKPIINRKYRVKGIIKANPLTGQPYLVEIKKTMIIPVWIFLTVGGIILLIMGILILLLVRKRRKDETRGAGTEQAGDPS